MCDFFVTADPILYESRTRSVRIHGIQTSIRLENFVWDTLATLAAEENMTTNALIVQFHDEIFRHRGDVQNFTSFLRVTCLRYLHRKYSQLEERFEIDESRKSGLLPIKGVAPTAH
jgi:predicted DNA-binding ribbon-helix-helix protein